MKRSHLRHLLRHLLRYRAGHLKLTKKPRCLRFLFKKNARRRCLIGFAAGSGADRVRPEQQLTRETVLQDEGGSGGQIVSIDGEPEGGDEAPRRDVALADEDLRAIIAHIR